MNRIARVIASVSLVPAMMACTQTGRVFAKDQLAVDKERRCGQLVVMAALSVSRVSFSVDTIKKDLMVGKDGVDMLSIRQLLEAHGLRVSGRTGVTYEDYCSFVSGSRLAILPIIKRGTPHYIMLMRRQEDDQLVWVDPLEAVIPLNATTPALESYDGTCLLIESQPTSSNSRIEAIKAHVNFENGVIEHAPINIGMDGTTDVVLNLHNTSRFPVAISRLNASCGCAVAEAKTMILAAKSMMEVTVKINNSGWGRGLQRKTITVESQGHEIAQAELVATGLLPEEVLGIVVEPRQLVFNATEDTWISFIGRTAESSVRGVAKTIDLRSKSGNLPPLQITSAEPFVLVEPEREATAVGHQRFSIAPLYSDALISRLSNSNAQVRTRVLISSKARPIGMEVPVVLQRASCYGFAAPRYRCSMPKSNGLAVIELVPKAMSFHLDCDGGDVEVKFSGPRTASLRSTVMKRDDLFEITVVGLDGLAGGTCLVVATVKHGGFTENASTLMFVDEE